jgi:hypothetical protein
VPEIDGALKKEKNRRYIEKKLFEFLTSYKVAGMAYLMDSEKFVFIVFSNDWTAEVSPFFSIVVESCSCPLCVVNGAHAIA